MTCGQRDDKHHAPPQIRHLMQVTCRSRGRAVVAALLSFVLSPGVGVAQSSSGLTIVAPASPGGGWDQLARTMARVLESERLAPRVQVINLPGAAGTIGLARFATALRGDPNALLVTGLVMVGGIVANRTPVTLERTTPLARLVGEYEVIVVPASSPFLSLAELLDTLRARPGAISWGGGSAGGTDQILVDLLAQHAGVDPRRTNYVAFAGGGEAVAALLGAQVTAGVSGYGEFESHIASGRLRALAISSRERVTGVDIPTLRESGVPIDLANWRGVVAPPGTRPARQRELIALLDAMRGSAAWQEELRRRGWADLWLDGAAFARFLAAETARVEALARVKRGEAELAQRRQNPYERLTLIGLCVAALLAFVRRGRRAEDVSGAPQPRPLLLLLAGMLLNVVLINVAGFVIAGAVLGWCAARAFGARRPVRAAVASLLGAAATFIVFDVALGVRLPRGALWERLLG